MIDSAEGKRRRRSSPSSTSAAGDRHPPRSILTAGGPQDTTHIFATYAFEVGIQSGDVPMGATVSLFMLPILAVASFFILRGVARRSREMDA